MEPVLRPRKNSSVGLSSVISVSATPSDACAAAPLPPGAAPRPGGAPPAVGTATGRPARLDDCPPTIMRAAGNSAG